VIFRLTGLWQHTEFKKLWAGQAISLTSSQLMYIALAVTAVSVLDATPFQMGVVTAMQGVPALLGLFIGAWTDHHRRLPIIVGVDLGRFALLLALPIAYLFDLLSMELIYFVAFGIAFMGIVFQIAYRSLLPSIVERHQLIEANSKLQIANSGSVAIGPALGGAIVQFVLAPVAVIFSSVLFLVSAAVFGRMKVDDDGSTVKGNGGDGHPSGEIRQGLNYFRSNKSLVGMAISGISLAIFLGVYGAVSLIYFIKHLEIELALLGVMFAFGSIGLVSGSIVCSRYTKRIGVGRLMTLGLLIAGLGWIAIPFASGSLLVIIPVLVLAAIALEAGIVIYSVQQVSLRQAITPIHLQGRMNSIFLVVSRGAIPAGALLGGFLGEQIGVRNTLFVAGFGVGSSAIWVLLFGVWRVRALPEQASS
jgi:predicted MFS family arabinose efflux permease